MHVRFQFLGKKRPIDPKEEEGIELIFPGEPQRGETPYWLEPCGTVKSGGGERACWARPNQRLLSKGFNAWHCTREKGHPGDHAAHLYGEPPIMLARWRQEGQE